MSVTKTIRRAWRLLIAMGIALVLVGILAPPSHAAGLRTLVDFTGPTNGCNPYGGLALSGSTLYGTTIDGGSGGKGTIFAYDLPQPLPEPATAPILMAFAAALAGLRAFRKTDRRTLLGPGAKACVTQV